MSTSTSQPTYFQRTSTRRRVVDLTVLAILFLLALPGFHTVYGGAQYMITGVIALLLGLLIALIGARFRLGPLRIALMIVLVHLLLGSVFAAPTHALFGVVPTLGSLMELLTMPVTTWKSVVTVSPPVGAAQGVLGVVWLSMLLMSVLSASIVLRTRHYALAWLFPLAMLLITVVFGTSTVALPLVRGVLAAVLSVAWLTWRFESGRLDSAASTIISDTERPGSWKNPVLRRRVIGGAVILALSAGIAVAAAPLLDPPEGTQRYALRDRINPPFDPRDYVSPLADFRGYIKHQEEAVLFTITDVEQGDKVRLASLDRYDNQVYNVAGSIDRSDYSGVFLPTASGVNLHEAGEGQRTSTITIGQYAGVWMPTLGERTDRIDLEEMPEGRAAVMSENLFLNERSQTAVDASGIRAGDAYTVRYEPYSDPSDEETRTATFDPEAMEGLPEIEDVPTDLRSTAEEWLGDSDDDMEQVQYLLRKIKADGTFTHGIEDEAASYSGHGIRRLMAMFEEIEFDEDEPVAYPYGMLGDQEQYAALAAVMLRSVGVPARVVMGFEVPEGSSGTVDITGADVTAWVEVAFTGIGWVRFDAHPDEEDTPVQPEPQEIEKPRPQVAQPPPPPAEPPNPPPGAMSEDTDKEDEPQEETSAWVVYVGLAVIPLLLLTLIVTSILVAKALRRRRRRRRPEVHASVDGGWQEILDLLTDMKQPADPVATRAEIARELEARIPSLGAASLAVHADRAVFGPDDLGTDAVDDYWSRIREARRGLAASLPWHRRVRAALSLRSFRRASAERKRENRIERSARRARTAAERRRAALRGRSSSGKPLASRLPFLNRKGSDR